MKKRIHKILKIAAALLIFGSAYAIFVLKTGLSVPCVFRSVTGLKCPGCGITRMITSLLKLNFKAAFTYNGAVLSILPVIAYLLIFSGMKYVKNGKVRFDKFHIGLSWGLVMYCIIWGIVRNLYQGVF